MKKFYVALFAMAAALAITPAAKATTFYFDYDAAGVSSTGTLVGTETGNPTCTPSPADRSPQRAAMALGVAPLMPTQAICRHGTPTTSFFPPE